MAMANIVGAMEMFMKVTGLTIKLTVLESILTWTVHSIKVNGKRERKKDLGTFKLMIIAFSKELSRIIIVQDSEPKNLLLEIHIKDSIKKVNSMERESIYGLQELASRDILLKESSKVKENGDQKQVNCLLGPIFEIENMDLDSTSGIMEQFSKDSSKMTNSNFHYI